MNIYRLSELRQGTDKAVFGDFVKIVAFELCKHHQTPLTKL